MPIGEFKSLFQGNIPVYFAGDLNAHHQAFGYSSTDNKGRILKDLINKGMIKHLGPEFPILVGKSTKPDIILGNKYPYLNLAIEEGSITTSDHLPIVIKINTKPIFKKL